MKKLSNSKNLSARKLLLMIVNDEHTSYCQRKDLQASECSCLRYEIKRWQALATVKNTTNRPKKVHMSGATCAKKPNAIITHNSQGVTCCHCLKLISKTVSSLPNATQVLGLTQPNPMP